MVFPTSTPSRVLRTARPLVTRMQRLRDGLPNKTPSWVFPTARPLVTRMQRLRDCTAVPKLGQVDMKTAAGGSCSANLNQSRKLYLWSNLANMQNDIKEGAKSQEFGSTPRTRHNICLWVCLCVHNSCQKR